jgi:hypothetical protein
MAAWRTGLLLGLMALTGMGWALFAASPAPAATANLGASQPLHYIANYDSRVQSCRGFSQPPFVTWNSYAELQGGDGWIARASSKSLCKLARKTGPDLLDARPFNDGAGGSKSDMEGYAVQVGAGITDQRIKTKGVPRGMKCFGLPSQWGTEVWQFAATFGGTLGSEFAQASGIAAGAGYCVNAKAKSKAGLWAKTPFIDWTPDPDSCTNRWRLHQDPDPDNPGEFLPPPSYADAQVFGSYDTVGC